MKLTIHQNLKGVIWNLAFLIFFFLFPNLLICKYVLRDVETKHMHVWIFTEKSFGLLICRDHSNFVNCVRFSPDGSKFISVSSDKKGLIYDAKTAEKMGELSSEDGHKGSIYAVSWSPDGKQVSVAFQFLAFFKNYF